jgi:hypothetical protein
MERLLSGIAKNHRAPSLPLAICRPSLFRGACRRRGTSNANAF